MFCEKCGKEIPAGVSFCPNCGTPVTSTNSAQQSTYNQTTGQQQTSNPNGYQQVYTNTNMIPEEYKPISMWGYFGYEILFAIPIVGLICLIIFSFGGTKNKNLKNFARSYFCFLIILAVLFAIIFVIAGAGITSSYYSYY